MPRVYTTHCPQCEVLCKKLTLAGIQFETCENMEEITKLGFKSAPILEADGKFMSFKQAIDWIKEVQ